jgi:hypothetical protein
MKRIQKPQKGDIYRIPLADKKVGYIGHLGEDFDNLAGDVVFGFDGVYEPSNNYHEIVSQKIIPKFFAYTYIKNGIVNFGWEFVENNHQICFIPIPNFKHYMADKIEFDGINRWYLAIPFSGAWHKPTTPVDFNSLTSDVIFTPEEIKNFILTGSHGLAHEMFG